MATFNMNEYKIDGTNSVICDAIKYLKNHNFVPHQNGNYGLYGLNFFGCDSIIKYNDKLWKFLWFFSNNAVYVNEYGEQLFLKEAQQDGIIRMEEA